MGCDIHVKCEVKKDGVWRLNTKPVFKNGYYVSDEELQKLRERHGKYERQDWQEKEFLTHPDEIRNYDWFAVLADVRNGRGFAGCKTGDGFVPIADPRGVPEDATKEWKKIVEEWNGDMHSHSWLTVQDFIDYDWSRDSIKEGVISLEQYTTYRGTNTCPQSWCGAVIGPKIITISQAEADDYLDGKEITVMDMKYSFPSKEDKPVKIKKETNVGQEAYKIHVVYRWTIQYKEWFEYFLTTVVEPMKKLKEKYEDVRLVFGFDN